MIVIPTLDRELERKPAVENEYQALLTNFNHCYQNMKTCSDAFDAMTGDVAERRPEGERQFNIVAAAKAYEDAREDFLHAVRRLNDHLIGDIVSRYSSIVEVNQLFGNPPKDAEAELAASSEELPDRRRYSTRQCRR